MTTEQVLRDALALFGPNGQQWIKGAYQNNGFCVVGAVRYCYGPEGPACHLLAIAAGTEYDSDLERWNDAPERTFADVCAIFKSAIKAAKGTS